MTFRNMFLRFWELRVGLKGRLVAISGPSWDHLGAILSLFRDLGAIVELLGTQSGPFAAILGYLWPSWVHLRAILGPSWTILAHFVAMLGPSEGHLGAILGQLEAMLGHLGTILGHLGAA